jgi:DNA-binding NarL/FixJ family response regulator
MIPIRVLISDDHRLLREAWSFILNRDTRFQVVADCCSSEVAILQQKALQPAILLLNISVQNTDTIEQIGRIRKFCPGWKILVISPYSFPDVARKTMKAGASGYVTKTSSMKELLEAIVAVRQGKKYQCEEIKKIDHAQMRQSPDAEERLKLLTSREIEIISVIKKGLTSREIAQVLKITTKTVERHRYTISKKLNLHNTPQLVDFINRYHPDL